MPKHISIIPETDTVIRKDVGEVEIPRRAVAPYNFIELPDKIVEADANGKLALHNCYDSNLKTGRIECTLTTSSPLYIRAGLDPETYQQVEKSTASAHFFYTNPDTKDPVLPASSLRGMFRTLVEISSFSKISKVSDYQKFSFRAVAAFSDDPLSDLYKNKLKNVKAGYLKEENGNWSIRPAKLIEGQPFAKIKDEEVTIANFVHMNEAGYKPQYISNVSFSLSEKSKRRADKLSQDPQEFVCVGVLVTSGNMIETEGGNGTTKRKNHYLINQPDTSASILNISAKAISDYCQSLTPFQKYGSPTEKENEPSPFNKELGVLKNGRCIFYCEPTENAEEVILFGQSPNFRITYSWNKSGKATTATDFIPSSLKDSEVIDIAESIFGYVQDKKQAEIKGQARASKISFLDGICQEKTSFSLFMTGEDGRIPKILASPKPTTFQHYLVQTSAEKESLNHYASEPQSKTVIRGHKLYWHQGKSPDIWHPTPSDVSEKQKQITHIRPIKPDKKFKFEIKFENLSSIELGVLLWILEIASNEKYRLSLGMGKPLGMGAVKIESKVFIGKRSTRYQSLFDKSNEWSTGNEKALSKPECKQHIQKFEQHIFKELKENGRADISRLRRIQMLLKMLEWKETLSEDEKSQRRYMEIERDIEKEHIGSAVESGDEKINEYRERPILPDPLRVDQNTELMMQDLSKMFKKA